MLQYSILTLEKRFFLSPHLIRIFLTGDEVVNFKDATLGANNKIFIPNKNPQKVNMPRYDYDKYCWIYPDNDDLPFIRTYTHRNIDLTNNHMVIDFAYHGDESPASSWAANAKIGDPLGVVMKIGKVALYPPVDYYLLIADLSGLPVISVILESLPKTVKAKVVLEIPSSEDKINIETKADVEWTWLINAHPEKSSMIPDAVKQLDLSKFSSKYAYVACEYSAVKEVRKYLSKTLLWDRSEVNAYSYWKAGQNEQDSENKRSKESE